MSSLREWRRKTASLSVLIRSLEGTYTTIDMANDSSAYGLVFSVDTGMNILMHDVTFHWPNGRIAASATTLPKLYVAGRHIRYVHIPDDVDMVKAINMEIDKVIYGNDQYQRKRKPTSKAISST